MKINTSLVVIALVVIFSGCINEPDYPEAPRITSVSITTSLISQLDTIRIFVEFTDGDGDLGLPQGEPTDTCNTCDSSCLQSESFNLFLIDSRTGCTNPYVVPFIPEKGSSDAISGEIRVASPPASCLPIGNIVGNNPPFDTLVYYIQLKDRAGRLSNVVPTPQIIIDC